MRNRPFALAVLLLGAGCADGTIPPDAPLRSATLDQVLLPADDSAFAAARDGRGAPRNRLGLLLELLRGQGLDAQGLVDADVKSGALALPVTARGDDPGPAEVRLGAATIAGRLDHGRFTAAAAPSTGATLDLTLGSLPGGTLRLRDLDLALAPCGPGTLDDGSAWAGELHAAVRKDELETLLLPAIARHLTELGAADENWAVVVAILDIGGCPGATAHDGVVDACELAGHPQIAPLLAPDLTLPDGPALSFGVGLHARPR